MLFTSSELLFTLSCYITWALLGTKKIASIRKKTYLAWVRLDVNYWSEIQKGDCDPSRQDISGHRSISVIRGPPWHVMVEEQSQASALSLPFSRAVRAGRPEEHLWLVAVPPSGPKNARLSFDVKADLRFSHSDRTCAIHMGFSPSWAGLAFQLLLSWVEQWHRVVDFTPASSQSLIWMAQIWLWL